MTNADRIRAMTDEELAEWCAELPCCPPGPELEELCGEHPCGMSTETATRCWLGWLQKEAADD